MGIADKLNYYASFKDSDVFQPGRFNPGMFDTNKKKVKKLYPRSCSPLVAFNGPAAEQLNGIIRQMNDGDLSTGVVMSVDPLLVACYSDDFDAVVMYCYPTELGVKMGWSVGTRLLTVNWYDGLGKIKKNKDLDRGPHCNISTRLLVRWWSICILTTPSVSHARSVRFPKKCGPIRKSWADGIWKHTPV